MGVFHVLSGTSLTIIILALTKFLSNLGVYFLVGAVFLTLLRRKNLHVLHMFLHLVRKVME